MTDEGKRLWQRIVDRKRIGGIGIAATAQFRRECLGLSIHQFEVHRGIIRTSGLMDIDIEPVVALHLERCLHASR